MRTSSIMFRARRSFLRTEEDRPGRSACDYGFLGANSSSIGEPIACTVRRRFAYMRLSGLLALILSASWLQGAETAKERLTAAADVFSEIMGSPDKGIPQDLLEKSQCVVIIPGMKKGAFVVGGEYGKGFVECRKAGGGWGSPAAIRIEGGSFGFQIGGEGTDVVMLVMNKHGMDQLMKS